MYASRFLTPISLVSYIPIKRPLYSVTLLEYGSVKKNAQGITYFSGDTSTTPTPTTNFPVGPILDALLKNNYQTSSSKNIWVI